MEPKNKFNDKFTDEVYWKLLEDKGLNPEKREKMLLYLDCGQVMNSSCDFLRYPNIFKLDNSKNRRFLKNISTGYDFSKNGDLYAIICFEI